VEVASVNVGKKCNQRATSPRGILSHMNDPMAQTIEAILRDAEASGLHVFYGFLTETNRTASVHWNSDHGGDWKKFLACARTLSAQVLYINWIPFEQFEIDESSAKLQSDSEDGDQSSETKESIEEIRAFQSKVGMTCAIDVGFIANGVVHLYQDTADWFDAFNDLVADDEDDDEADEPEEIDASEVRRWATALASDSRYCTTTQRNYLLEQIAGPDYSRLPTYKVLLKAEAIYNADYKQAAEEKLAKEVLELREHGLNQKAIGLKLGISQGRVSGILSLMAPKRKSPA
jgi:hypothetical protein